MKKPIVLFAIFITTGLARADLIIQEQIASSFLGSTNHITFRVHGAMMREDDSVVSSYGQFVHIFNTETYADILLNLKTKTFKKFSESKPKEDSGVTNTADSAVSAPSDTGESEKIGELETKIYFWTNGKDITWRFWVAKDYPDFKTIRSDLVKLDAFEQRRPEFRQMRPPRAGLPGMVIKAKQMVGGQKIVVTLVSTRVEPVETSLFEIPSDYTEAMPKLQ